MANNWSSNTPLAAALVFPEIQIPHTNGVATNKAGYETNNLRPAYGMGVDGNGNLVPSYIPNNMMSLPIPNATISSISINTNILLSDLPSNQIQIEFGTSYKTAPNAATTGARALVLFDNDPLQFAQQNGVSTLNIPPLVGDTGTLYTYIDAFTFDGFNSFLPNGLTLPAGGIGTGGTYSDNWFSFFFSIPAAAITKTYRFQITLGYV